ncbi:MAG: helix-turn-helix domain-containing protein [Shimia sp.]
MTKRPKGKRGEGQYAPLSYALLKSPAWRGLSGSAVKLFLELHTRFNGSNNGTLRLSFAEAAEALGLGKATVQRAYVELQDAGFIVLEAEGNWYHRRAHEWRLTTKPTKGTKGTVSPTNEWRQRPAPPKTERGSETDPSRSKVVPLRNRKAGSRPTSEPVRRRT